MSDGGEVEPIQVELGDGDEGDETPRRGRGRPPMPRTCGNCLFIRYSDAQLLSGLGGSCARSQESGRVGVQDAEAGCARWVRRSIERRNTDKTRREAIRLSISGGKRRRGG